MELFIDDRQDYFKISDELLENIKKAILESLKVEGRSEDSEVSLSFVTDEEIHELNRDYRGVDRSTDVLSFPMEMSEFLPVDILGDIIISTQTAISQAEEFNHSVDREIIYLTVHSMFHLMGYDHIEEEDKIIMRKKEEEVLNNLGFTRDF